MINKDDFTLLYFIFGLRQKKIIISNTRPYKIDHQCKMLKK